jgi:hypothetical protein
VADIPCFLCGTDLEIRTDKNKKRYFICDHCGVQSFVRKETGILLLEELLRNLRTRDFEFAKHKESFFRICAVLNEISDLKGQIKKLERQRGLFSADSDKERAIKALKARVSALLSALQKHSKEVPAIAK